MLNCKTCTVTFHNVRNYGAYLQAYALQQFLGESNYILNLMTSLRSLVGAKWRQKLPVFWMLVALWRYYFKPYNLRKNFFNEINMLNLTDKYSSAKGIMKNLMPTNVYITGSDQVWNPRFINEMENIYFLQFISQSARRISYAASLGMPKWPKEFEQKVLPWLKSFHAISVREESSVEYLRSLGLDSVCVCDPTVLHTADFYRNAFKLKNPDSENYIFTYKIRESIPILTIKKTITVNLHDKNLVSVRDWLSLIDNSDFILTDSFHCVVFCVLFHKPFAVFQNNYKGKGMNERFTTILGKINLEYRLLQGTETEEQILNIVKQPVSWDQVDSVLEEWRSYSKNWLMEAIK